jgi:cell division protein FtsN
VRVGPFASKSDAQEAVKKIKALQLDAMIVQP